MSVGGCVEKGNFRVSETHITDTVRPLSIGLVSKPLRLLDRRSLVHTLHVHIQHVRQLANDLEGQ